MEHVVGQVTAVVPFRDPGHGKSRLRSHLNGVDRAALSETMLATVVTALGTAGVGRLVVVAGGAGAVAAAERLGVDVVTDPPATSTLDDAVAAAVDALHPHDLLVVAADLPGVTAADITAVLASPAAVVIAPTRDGGTAALLRRPHDVIATAYGVDSARRHRDLAVAAGATVEVIERPGLALDVDTWDDLVAARARGDSV